MRWQAGGGRKGGRLAVAVALHRLCCWLLWHFQLVNLHTFALNEVLVRAGDLACNFWMDAPTLWHARRVGCHVLLVLCWPVNPASFIEQSILFNALGNVDWVLHFSCERGGGGGGGVCVCVCSSVRVCA